MLCPKCKLEGTISNTRYVVENDTTEESETKLFYEQDIKCENKRCENYETVFTTMRVPLDIG